MYSGNNMESSNNQSVKQANDDFIEDDWTGDWSGETAFWDNVSKMRNISLTCGQVNEKEQGDIDWGFGSCSQSTANRRDKSKHHKQNRFKRKEQKPVPQVEALTGKAADKYLAERRATLDAQYAKLDTKALLKESEEYAAKMWATYPPIIKSVYVEHPHVAKMTSREVEQFRKINQGITVQLPPGNEIQEGSIVFPNPIPCFKYAFTNLKTIQDLLMDTAFKTPSPIQAQAWPLIMKGHDVIGIAQTGTGKTLAFLLPAYAHIMMQKRQNRIPGAHVLIIAPTRELAIQINDEVKKFPCAGIKSVVIYGGADRKMQIRAIKEGCNIIIATPGRLDDLITARHIDITSITYVVLDEADRMLDDGFEGVIRKTMYRIRPDRQTIMTSATWPDGVRRLAKSYMQDPIQVVVGSMDLMAVHTISQKIIFFDQDNSTDKVVELMKFAMKHQNDPDLKVVVFSTSKARARCISTEMALTYYEVSSIRGDMDQEEREQAIADIKSGYSKYLIATDVASRGIDIPNLTHVINFDFPRDIEEYVHRVGRTGRAGKAGSAITYFTFYDSKHAGGLIEILEKSNQPVPSHLYYLRDGYTKRRQRRGNNRPTPNRYNASNYDSFC